MNSLLFASHNENKTREIRRLLPTDFQIKSLTDINYHEEIPETETTIEGNAILKAQFGFQKFHLDCFADDSGLEVRALPGAPGVFSARYAGEHNNTSHNIDKLLRELQGIEDRSAQFKTVIALCIGGEIHTFTGIVRGHILSEPRGTSGFGYDPVFVPEGHALSFAEMTPQQKSELSHRGIALRKLLTHLEKLNP